MKSALDKILGHGKKLEDKLDAYYLKISLLHGRQEAKPAYDTCVDVLKQLGETIPALARADIVVEKVKDIQSRLDEMTEKDFMDMKTVDSPFHYSLMQFYDKIGYISYFANPPMLKWFACRLVELSFEHGFSKFAPVGMTRYSMILGGKLIHNVEEGYRVGKIALKLLDRFDATETMPMIYLVSQYLSHDISNF